ncbi:hypothetical protein [Cyanobium sp. NIES-981]|uniref:hypothetical protein n=1 Tax=Cyanobium sp. NIES-981 TaxID=1851505 RepID=UPI0012F797F8|nr:hypothetical protein [Cyanobium sp. NIES-981]
MRRPITRDQNAAVDHPASSRRLVQAPSEAEQSAPPPGDAGSAEQTSAEQNPTASDAAALAKEAQNPIANLISLPFQNNTNFGAGPAGEGTPNVLNIQPVIPVPLSKRLLLVTRTIVPVINQPAAATGQASAFGLGDINPQFYLGPPEKVSRGQCAPQ